MILGPTAVGKSALALHLAHAFDGEIVNADSRQVYRFMDIGTAKPSLEDRARVPHHLIDFLDPDQGFSLALFLGLARQAIHDIQARGKLPIVTGGTGQYVRALLEGWQVPPVPPDLQLRRKLEDQARLEGTDTLYRTLQEIDPEAASRIDKRNLRRVIRALEIHHTMATPPSTLRATHPPHYDALLIGLTTTREALYRKIDCRVEGMLEQGLVAEVQGLLRMGYSPELPCMSSMGYREIALYLNGELNLDEATRRIKYATHRFARRQYSWFRLSDARIHWLEAGDDVTLKAESLVEGFLRAGRGCGTIASATGGRSA